MHPIEKILGPVEPFFSTIFSALRESGITVSDCELDHLCYRVETLESYKKIKAKIHSIADVLVEANVGGRPIVTYRFHEPLQFEDREIWCIEIPSPKEGSPYTEGYEHVEFVIPVSLEDFMEQYADIEFDTRAYAKPVNRDISIRYDGFSVKFHEQSLEYVITHLE